MDRWIGYLFLSIKECRICLVTKSQSEGGSFSLKIINHRCGGWATAAIQNSYWLKLKLNLSILVSGQGARNESIGQEKV